MSAEREERRMSKAEFNAVRDLMKLTKDRTDAAYAVLVNGAGLKAVADQYGWTRQAVNGAVNSAMRARDKYRAAQEIEQNEIKALLPEGWDLVSMAAPVDLIEKFRISVSRRRSSK
ncbi:MAG: hypothetical protein CTY24_00065 [Methylobacter sp.]|nr:MAG: hypothetical protein CTY24_00065 [Methylobacter sp.]